MPGLISSIESSVSSGISNIATNVANQAQGLVSSLTPFPSQAGVVNATTDMPLYPPDYSYDSNDSFLNPNYQVLLYGTDETGRSVAIGASLPEHFSFHLASDWQPLLNNPSITSLFGANSGIIGDLAKAAGAFAKGVGFADYSAAVTQQVWNSTTPVDLAFPMLFNASQDASKDVMAQIRDLCLLVVPSSTSSSGKSGILKMPGPNIFSQISGKGYKIALMVGNGLVFDNVIVTGVSPVFDVMTDVDGNFISAQVDVAIRTTTILTKQDVYNIFTTAPLPTGSSALPSGYTGVSSFSSVATAQD